MSGSDNIIGRLLDGRYKVTRRFGAGGMGAVFLADDQRLNKQVVVKIPLPGMVADEAALARFDKEIDFLIQLDHPRIVKVLDKGTVDGVPYVVLQYLAGGSLMDRLSKMGGLMNPEQVHKWLEPVANATDFIHSKNRIHRDIKPANILFDLEGNAFLADFGIAKALDEPGVTKTGTIPGSPAYMGPECLKAQFAAPYDQYALATVVYQCLAGHLPYHDEEPGHLLFAKNSKDPEPLDEAAGPFPRGLAECVRRGLDRDPERRHPTCTEFASRFAGCLFRGAPLDDNQSTAILGRKEAPRWPRLLLYAGLSIGIVAALVSIWWYSTQPAALVDVQVRTVPPEAAVALADGTAVASGLLPGLRSSRSYPITISMPGYETFNGDLDPSAGSEQTFTLVADCSGAAASGSPYPVRLLFDGLDVPTQRQILDRFDFAGAVGSGCDYDVLVRGGPDAAIEDAGNRPLSTTLKRDGSDLPAALDDPLEQLYLERTLRGPGDGDAGALELVLSTSSDTSAPAESVFRIDDGAWTRVRSADKPHLMVLLAQSDGSLAILYPQDPPLAADRISTGDWVAVQQLTIGPPVGRETLMAFASGRSWSSLLSRVPTTPTVEGLTEGGGIIGKIQVLDDQSSVTARSLAEAVSTYLTSSNDWAADSQTYLIQN